MSYTRLSTWVGLGRKTLIGLCLLTLAACATQGSSFQASGLNQLVLGQSTRADAEQSLHGRPHQVYRQLDGSELAVWFQGSTLATDAVYFRQELWLQFDAQGRFQEVVKRSHIPATYREQARSAAAAPTGSVTIEHPGTDMITILPVSH